MIDDRSKDNTLLIHWVSHEEVCTQQEAVAVRESRPDYSDPTADEAIGRVIRDEKREKRKQQRHTKKPFHHPRIGVWRWDDEQRKAAEKEVKKDVR